MTTSTVTKYLSEDENKNKHNFFVNIQIQLQTYLVHSFVAIVSAFCAFWKKISYFSFLQPYISCSLCNMIFREQDNI